MACSILRIHFLFVSVIYSHLSFNANQALAFSSHTYSQNRATKRNRYSIILPNSRNTQRFRFNKSLYSSKLPTDKDKPNVVSSSSSDFEAPDTVLGRLLRNIFSTGLNPTITPGSLVIAKYDIPSFGIYADQSYELLSIFMQGINPETNEFERISLSSLTLDENEMTVNTEIPAGYSRYITLYSPIYHKDTNPTGVIVTPQEVGLVSLRDEVVDSVLVALPILSFWLATCFVFAGKYNERYGGNFIDALLGR